MSALCTSQLHRPFWEKGRVCGTGSSEPTTLSGGQHLSLAKRKSFRTQVCSFKTWDGKTGVLISITLIVNDFHQCKWDWQQVDWRGAIGKTTSLMQNGWTFPSSSRLPSPVMATSAYDLLRWRESPLTNTSMSAKPKPLYVSPKTMLEVWRRYQESGHWEKWKRPRQRGIDQHIVWVRTDTIAVLFVVGATRGRQII